MIHRQSGFTILEMIISIMISAMLMTASLTIYKQISKSAFMVQKITNQDTQMMVLYNRLTSDLQGLSPLWFTTEHYEQLAKAKKTDSAQKIPDIPSSSNFGSQKRNNFLYAQSQNNQFEVLTFITTNALQVFGDKQIRTVRIAYVLQPDPSHPNTFKLMRKEENTISGDFDLEKLKNGKLSQIAHKITKCSIEYGFIKPTKKSEQKETVDKAPQFTFVSQWGQQQDKQKEEEKMPLLPDIIKLTMKIQYQPDQEEKSYELLCPIPTCHATAIKSFAQKRQETEKPQMMTSSQSSSAVPSTPTPPTGAPNPGAVLPPSNTAAANTTLTSPQAAPLDATIAQEATA